MKKSIGFIGLGNMGSGMANNLLSAGFEVIGFDIDQQKYKEFRGSNATSTSEVAKECSIVILCLPHPDITNQVIFKELLGKDSDVSTIIETSTLTPEFVIELAAKLKSNNIKFLSAPMIGGKNAAHNKTIQFLVEGSKELFDSYAQVLEAMSSRTHYMGDAPAATLAKLVFNLCRYANLAVAVEAYRLIKPYNPNTEAIYDFVAEQSLDNFGQVWGEDMKEMMTKDIPFKPSQVPKKDLTLLSEMAEKNNVDDKLIKAIRDTYLSME